MNTIIITALMSVFITLAIGYFIWQFVRVRKLKKQVKDNLKNIKLNENEINNFNEDIFQEIEYVKKTINEHVDHFEQKINKEIEDNNKKIDDIYNNIQTEIDKNINNLSVYDNDLHKEIDRRFDTIYKKIEQKV